MILTFVTGTAGSGKSLLCSSLVGWYRDKAQDAVTVNLDPGVINLPYDPDVDIRTMIDLAQVMEDYSLGPNGALVFATDLIASKVSEIQDEIDSTGADFAIVDTPGQIELFAFRESGPFIAKQLSGDSKTNLFLIDSMVASSPTNFLSLSLLSTAVQLRMELPQLQVLSKTDLARGEAEKIVKWSREQAVYEEALSKVKSGEEYSFYTQLFRSLKKTSSSMGLHPVSSYTREGFIALVGELSRIGKGGEELEDT